MSRCIDPSRLLQAVCKYTLYMYMYIRGTQYVHLLSTCVVCVHVHMYIWYIWMDSTYSYICMYVLEIDGMLLPNVNVHVYVHTYCTNNNAGFGSGG